MNDPFINKIFSEEQDKQQARIPLFSKDGDKPSRIMMSLGAFNDGIKASATFRRLLIE